MLIKFVKDTMLKGKRIKANTVLDIKDSDARIFIATGISVLEASITTEVKPEPVTEIVKPVKTKKSK